MEGSVALRTMAASGRHLPRSSMPSLFRFVIVVAVLAGLAYGAMLALVTFVEPVARPMEQAIPSAKLNPPRSSTTP